MPEPIVNNEAEGQGLQNDADKFQEKAERTLGYFNDMDNPDYDDIEKDILATGLSIPEFRKEFIRSMDAIRPRGSETIAMAMPVSEDWNNLYDFRNSVWDDFATNWQGGMNRIGYGLGTVIPGVTAAFNADGESPEWVNDWIGSMGEWYENTKERTSDESNQSFFETGELRAFAGGMGSGLASMTPIVLSFIPYVGKAAYTATTFADVFGSILQNGQENGLSTEDAARMALVLSVPITAMEKVGAKGATKPLQQKAASWFGSEITEQAIKKVAKEGGKGISRESFEELVKVGLKDIGAKQMAKKRLGKFTKDFAKGAGTEGITETLQSIIEQTGEVMYDAYFADAGATEGKGKYGTQWGSKDFWLQAAEEGFYGALLGGGMAGPGGQYNGIREQSTYHYIRNSVESGKPQRINNLKNYAAKMHADKKLTDKEYADYIDTVDEMTEMEGRIWHKMDNPNAKYQAYNALKIKDKAQEGVESEWLASQERDNGAKKTEIDNYLGAIQSDIAKVVDQVNTEDDIERQENRKLKAKMFDMDYKYTPVDVHEIAPELQENIQKYNDLVPNELKIDPLNFQQMANEGMIQNLKEEKPITPKAAEMQAEMEKQKAEAKKKEDTAKGEQEVSETPKMYKDGDIELSEQMLNEKEAILDKVDEAQEIEDDTQREQAFRQIADDYDTTIDALNYLYQNPNVTKEQLQAVEQKAELKPESKPVKTTETVEKPTTTEETKKPESTDEDIQDEYDRLGNEIDSYDEEVNLAEDNLRQTKKLYEGEEGGAEEIELAERQLKESQEKLESKEYQDKVRRREELGKQIEARKEGEMAQEPTPSPEAQPTPTETVPSPQQVSEVQEQDIPDEVKQMPMEEIEAALLSEEINDEGKRILIAEQVRRAEQAAKAESDRQFLNEFNFVTPKDHRKKETSRVGNTSRIQDNPELYEKIKGHFKKIFPNIPVSEIDAIAEKFGPTTLARVTERGIMIDPTKALQSSLIHEYAHIYLASLGKQHPLVKVGKKVIENTQYFKDAQELYPDLTKDEQLEEALAEALATSSLEKLQIKFEGSTLAKFQEFAKRFWRKIKSFFTKSKSGDIVEILADGLTMSKTPFSVGVNNLVGMNKDQRKKSIDPRFLKTVDAVSLKLLSRRLKNIEDKAYIFDTKNKDDVAILAYGELLNQYYYEQNLSPTDVRIFNGVDMQMPAPSELDTADKMRSAILEFGDKVKSEFPDINKHANNVVQSMLKTNIELDDQVQTEDVDVDTNQTDAKESDSNKASIKANKKVNTSVRSIFATIVDESGHKIETDKIFEYVGRMSKNTKDVAGFKEAVKQESAENIIAHRINQIIEFLENETDNQGNRISEAQAKGFLKTITSLEQVKSEGSNISAVYNADGDFVGYRVTNPLKNKGETQGIRNIKDWKNSIEKQRKFLKLDELNPVTRKSDVLQAIKDYEILDNPYQLNEYGKNKLIRLIEGLNELFDANLTFENFGDLITEFKATKFSPGENLYYSLFGQKASLKAYWQGDVEFKNISGYVNNLEMGINKNPILSNTYLNGANNTVTTTQMGHWVSQLNSILMNSDRIDQMEGTSIFGGNKVLDFFKKNGIDYMVPDSLKNIETNENIEHNRQSESDHHIEQLHKFATSSSSDFYSQSVGVLSNRDNKLYFRVPTYQSQTALNNAIDIQVKNLQAQVNAHTKGMTPEQLKKVETDFNKLYIHNAKIKDGKIEVTAGKVDKADIKKIKDIIEQNNLTETYSEKIGDNKPFKSFDEMLERYYMTEAVNRTFLSDIYAGPAIFHSNPNSSKGAVESFVKRMSALNSTGENIELTKPIVFVAYKNGKGADMTSDSFSFNSPGLTADIRDYSGSFDPVGINSKNNIFQVDPKTGKSLYVKSSTLNVDLNEDGTTNLDSFGEGYKGLANATAKLEKQLGTHVMLLDEDAFKGTFDGVKAIDANQLVKAVEEGNIDSIKANFSQPITIDNLRTPFNLNKKLDDVHKQETILSTQAVNIQYSGKGDMEESIIKTFESDVAKYLNEKMGGELEDSIVINDLKDFNAVVDMMIDDLNEREESSTSEILKAVRRHNQNPDVDPITSFDHSSLRLIYEQFISSRLSKRGIRVELPGNFMHQLPDLHLKGEQKLDYQEVAVSWKMFGNTKEEAESLLASTKAKGEKLKVAVVRIPASAPVSMFAGEVKYFLDTDANVVKLSDKFVDVSDSDHDGDKAMVYRQEMSRDGRILSPAESIKSKIFDTFYNNLAEANFENEALTGSLDFDKQLEYLGNIDYSSRVVNDIVDVTSKLNLGSMATGRYAIAGKLMSIMSQVKSDLNRPIEFQGQTLTGFNRDSMNDVAIFLQAALDMGNNPILSKTGFDEVTIDVGNAMLLLGLNKEQTIGFLKQPEIISLAEDFKESQVAFKSTKNKSLNSYLNDMIIRDNDGVINFTVMKEQYGDTVSKFFEFYEVANGLSKLIPFVQLDKKLPNTAIETSSLLDNISKFDSNAKGYNLPFNVDKLVNERELYNYRKNVLKQQDLIYKEHLFSNQPVIQKIVSPIKSSMPFSSRYELQRRLDEQLVQYVSQGQISNEYESAKDFIHDFSSAMKTIYDVVKLGSTEVNMNEQDLGIAEAVLSGTQTKEFYYGLGLSPERMDQILAEYNKQKTLVEKAEAFKGNALFDYLEFTEVDGRPLVKLSPRFKATAETKEAIKKGVNDIKSIEPNMYRALVDYQLLRFGVNNKIGSFIDAMPMAIDLKLATDMSALKDNAENIFSERGRYFQLMDNLALKNMDLINEPYTDVTELDGGEFALEEDQGYYVKRKPEGAENYRLYKRKSNTTEYKPVRSKFESDNNFTRYEVKPLQKVATSEQINNILTNC